MPDYPLPEKKKRLARRARGVIPLFALLTAHHAVAQIPVSEGNGGAPAKRAVAQIPAVADNGGPPASHDDDVITVTAPMHSPLTVVTATKTPRQPVPASDGADYLKTIPGFALVRNGGTNGDPVLRGMFGSRLKILTDGAEILGTCPSRMDAPTAYISPESYDVLTLTKGPQTVLWGPGSSAGTLRFERLFPHFEEAGLGLAGSASLLAGSNARRDGNAQLGFGNEQGYLQITGNKSRANDYRDGGGARVPSKWDKWNGDLALGVTPDSQTRLELTMGRGNGQASYAGRGLDGAQIKRESLGMRFEKTDIGETLDRVEGQVYYNYANHVMDNTTLRSPGVQPSAGCASCIKRAALNPARRANLDRRTLGARAMGTWLWHDYQLQSGIDMQTNTHRAKKPDGWRRDARFQDYGLFSELTWHRSESQRVIGGARLDRALADKYAAAGDSARSTVLPAGFVRYEQQLGAPLLWYAGIGYTERFPDYWELFAPKSGPRVGQDPFNTVKSEKTTQLDVGVHYVEGGFNGWLSGYLGRVNDFILMKYDPVSASRSQSVNVGARIMGAEAGFGYQFTERWKSETSLAWAWGKNTSDGRPLPQMPPVDARFGLTYEQERWSSTALWRVVAPQRRVALNEGNAAGKDFSPSAGFGVLSANVAYKVTKNVKLSGGIDNILDKRYSEHLNLAGNSGFGYSANSPINEPGRTLWAKMNMTF